MNKPSPATVSFSVDTELRDDLNKLAAKTRRSKSDLFREMYNYYRFKVTLNHLQDQGTLIAERLGLATDDDVYDYLSHKRAA